MDGDRDKKWGAEADRRPAAEHAISNLWACGQWKLRKLTSLSQVPAQVTGSSCSPVSAPSSQQCPTLLLWAVFP